MINPRLSDAFDLSFTQDGYTDVELRHTNYVYDNLEELTAHVRRQAITSLEISAWGKTSFRSRLMIMLKQDHIWIRGGPDSAEKAAAIAHYLRSKVPWYSWRPTGAWWSVVRFILGWALGGAAAITLAELIPAPREVRLLLAGIVWAVPVFMSMPDRAWVGGTRIRLYAAGSQAGFWERNRDKILVGTLLSLLSALLGFLLARITQ